jgi:acyl-CoA hydrolase
MPALRLHRIEDAVALLRSRVAGDVVLAAPLGIGKPHRLLNAIYRDAARDASRRLRLLTALSLTPPRASSDLERRFLAPFLERQFGADFPVLEYVLAQQRGALPAHVEVEEFYLQSGALLGKPDAQRRYASLNYTHVARAVAARGVNALVQLVAMSPDGTRLSLSCNPDLTLDLIDEVARVGGARPLLIAEVHPGLPFLEGAAAVPTDYFDAVLELAEPAPKLFALPRQPVSDPEYAIGLYASTLVKDGGTLQIGIGALSDALCHALILRHGRNDEYRRVLRALWPQVESSALIAREGGLDPFVRGQYGASEMVRDGFMHLVEAGILTRRVVDDVDVMQRDAAGTATESDRERMQRDGQFLHGGFWLGSHAFYDWLRGLDPAVARGIGMSRISHINELYGGNETLERLQRREPRFFNTCMMMNVLGAATSDALDTGQVVSGVGGQYNFVAMAHALHDSRSVLMLRATREVRARVRSNIVTSYGHTTIPRHLRDLVITEYGIADLRDACDEDCVIAMLGIAEGACQPALLAEAKRNGKIRADFAVDRATARNSATALAATLAPFRRDGLLPDYPLGSDFTDVEQRLVKALGWLKRATATRAGLLRTLASALGGGPSTDVEAMQRMDLASPLSLRERINARLVALGLRRSTRGDP